MSDIFAAITGLGSAISSLTTGSVQRAHIAFLEARLQQIREFAIKLEQENTELIRRNAELEKQAARQHNAHQFVEHAGALFKPLAAGGYSETPYCPACQSAMWAMAPIFPYECGNQSCKRIAGFLGGDLKTIIAALPK